MKKLIAKLIGGVTALAMAIGVGVAVANNKVEKVDATVGLPVTIGSGEYNSVYETGFESAPTTTTYNQTKSYTSAECDGASWTIYYGTVSTNAKITGSNSGQMRWYSSASTNYPYAMTTSNIANVKAVKFNYAVGNTNVKFDVLYSSDSGSNWTKIETVQPASTSAAGYSHEFTDAISTFRIKILVSDTSTAPESGNYTFRIDDVCFGEEKPAFGTLHHVKVGTPASKLTFEVGETFSSSGLVLTGYDGENETTANTTSYSSGYTTNYDGHTFVEGDIGAEKTVTVTYSGKATTYTIDVEAAPNFVIDGDENAPDGLGEDTSTTATDESQINGTGINYGYYAFAINNYQGAKNLEFNRAVQDAYFGNNESYGKYIKKIRITLQYESNFSKLTMYKGDSAIPGTTGVSSSGSGTSRVYNFNNDSEYFALKQTTTGSWIVITKIEVYLGSDIPVVDSVVASIKSGTYYAGATLSSSDFNVTVTWTAGKADTAPTEGFTWVIGDGSSSTLVVGNNSVKVVYQGVESDSFNVVGTPASAQDVIENTITTQSALTYHYSKNPNIVTDVINYSFVGIDNGAQYTDWSDKEGTSHAVYTGNSTGGDNNSGNVVQIRSKNSNSGIVATETGGLARKVTVVWNNQTAAGNKLDVYGKNEAYSAPSELYNNSTQGTKLGTIEKGDSTELTIVGDYEFIALRSYNGALYLDSIEIDWENGYNFTYSNVAIRFGGFMTQDLWNELDTNEHNIEGYGVLLTDESIVGENDDIAVAYSLADGSTIIDYYSGDLAEPKTVPSEATAAQKTAHGVAGDYYIWNLYLEVEEANFGKTYVAGAYIKLKNGDIIFMKKTSFSVYGLAADYISNRGYNSSTASGSLSDLASHA